MPRVLIIEDDAENRRVMADLFRRDDWKVLEAKDGDAGLELALRTGDPESALEQLRPSHASCLSALGRPSGEIQERAAQGKQGGNR